MLLSACRCATCGLTCSTARASAPREPARRCWRLPGQAGKASFLRKLRFIHSPTAIGWIIGRTQTNGKADYDAVHKFQAGLIATPLQPMGQAVPATGRQDQSRLGHGNTAHHAGGKAWSG